VNQRQERNLGQERENASTAPEVARPIARRYATDLFAEAHAVFAAIDSIVRLACNSVELHRWRAVSRVPKRMGRPPKPETVEKKGQRKKALAKKGEVKP